MRKAVCLCVALLCATHNAFANDTIKKSYCAQAFGYPSLDEMKKDLLLNAKRLAVNELFGELIIASTAVKNFILTSDQVRTSSIGFVRVDGDVAYSNSPNLGEICVSISAYTTEEDRRNFQPVTITKRTCVSDPNLTAKEIRSVAEKRAVVQALIEYDRKLEGIDEKRLLQLVQQVKYSESGFVPETETYCTKVLGVIYPINIVAATSVEQVEKSKAQKPERNIAAESDLSRQLCDGDKTAFVGFFQGRGLTIHWSAPQKITKLVMYVGCNDGEKIEEGTVNWRNTALSQEWNLLTRLSNIGCGGITLIDKVVEVNEIEIKMVHGGGGDGLISISEVEIYGQ